MKRLGIGIVVVMGLCLAAGFGATAALAVTNTYITQFSGEKTEATFFEPYALAVNSEGDVYVGDREDDVVDEFDSTGTTLLAEFNGKKTTKGFFQPRSLAVNSEGDVYVGDYKNEVVDEFKPPATGETEPTPLAEFNGGKTNGGYFSPRSLAVNSEGDVYVGDEEHGVVDKFGPPAAGKTEPEPLAEFKPKGVSFNPLALAVNSVGDVYVADRENNVVDEFGPPAAGKTEPTPLAEITGPPHNSFASVSAVALAPSGEVYVGDEVNKVVDRFKPKGASGNEQYEYEYVCQVNGTKSTEQCGREASKTPQESFEPFSLAVAPDGELYVGDTQNKVVDIFSSDVKVVLPKFELTVAESTEGEVVGSEGATGINCGTGAACKVKVEEGELVTLTSTKFQTGFTFEKWTATKSLCQTANPCTFTMPGENVNVAAKYEVFTKHPLTVRVTGKGEVNDGKVIDECTSSGGTCTEEAEGKVTLTAKAPPGSGSVFAGWIGECQKETPTECEVDVTAATKVTAVFLQEGVQGKNGESPVIKSLPPGDAHCPAGGFEIVFQLNTEYLCNGEEGKIGVEGGIGEEGLPGKMGVQGVQGERGAAGASGATGLAGAQGAPGPAGPAGKEGPAGKVELVTCKKVGKQQKCTTKTVSGTVKFTTSSARATLSRHGIVFAAGTARAGSHGNMSLRLTSLRGLRPGKYTLTLISGAGRHERIHSEAFTLG
jgi:uncharacterized repeat protein (TIGR02543 family)